VSNHRIKCQSDQLEHTNLQVRDRSLSMAHDIHGRKHVIAVPRTLAQQPVRSFAGRYLSPIQCPPMPDPRIEKLADVLVNYSVGVKKGQLVRITSTPAALELVNEVFRRVLAAGGHPFTKINAEETGEIFLKNATPEQLSYLNPI